MLSASDCAQEWCITDLTDAEISQWVNSRAVMSEIQNRKGNVPRSSLAWTQRHLLIDTSPLFFFFFLFQNHWHFTTLLLLLPLSKPLTLHHSSSSPSSFKTIDTSPLFFFSFLFQNHSRNSSVQQLFLNFFTAVFIPTIHRQCLCTCLCGVCGCMSFVSACVS